MLKCHDDYRTFYKYKKGKFFDDVMNNEKSVKQRTEEVNMVKSKIREESNKQKL